MIVNDVVANCELRAPLLYFRSLPKLLVIPKMSLHAYYTYQVFNKMSKSSSLKIATRGVSKLSFMKHNSSTSFGECFEHHVYVNYE